MRSFVVIAAALSLAAPSSSAGVQWDLSGTWVLNRNASEEPAFEVVGFDAPPELLTPDTAIGIEISAATVTIVAPHGTRCVLGLAGQLEAVNVRGLPVLGRAQWDGSTLRLELAATPEVTVLQNYTVDATSNRLSVTVRPCIGHRQADVTIRHVYDRAATSLIDADIGVIRFEGHLSKGEYDVQTGGRHTKAASAPPIHGRVEDRRCAPGAR
jgi:hypothetical protein